MKLKDKITISFGGFGLGIWRVKYFSGSNYPYIWTVAIGPWCIYISSKR